MNKSNYAALGYDDLAPKSEPMTLTERMVSAGNRNGWLGTGNMRPEARRPGSMEAYNLPSNVNGQRVYPKPRVNT